MQYYDPEETDEMWAIDHMEHILFDEVVVIQWN
jgi:hypothetical protein